MKRNLLKFSLFALLGVFSAVQGVKACNLSSLTLVSVTGSGPYVITVNLCIGMGLTGATKGGDQRTASIFFGFWDTTPGFAVTPGGFSPAQMISPAPAQATVPPTCRMTGTISGPNTTFGTAGSLVYPMPAAAPCAGGSGTSYGCINNTALCGLAISNCSTFVITVNQLPDSMRAFGVEGGGNPVGGCYPNADMKIDFTSFSVEWGEVEAVKQNTGVEVKWNTVTENNVDYFIVERAVGAGDFESIGEVMAVGNSNSLQRYKYFDNTPSVGANRYRIVQVDHNGASSESGIIEVNYFKPESISWGPVGPIPAVDALNISFYNPVNENVSVRLMDISGKVVMAMEMEAVSGGNSLRLDLTGINRGQYFVNVVSSAGSLVRKFAKL